MIEKKQEKGSSRDDSKRLEYLEHMLDQAKRDNYQQMKQHLDSLDAFRNKSEVLEARLKTRGDGEKQIANLAKGKNTLEQKLKTMHAKIRELQETVTCGGYQQGIKAVMGAMVVQTRKRLISAVEGAVSKKGQSKRSKPLVLASKDTKIVLEWVEKEYEETLRKLRID